ncbi:MAG: hypothetical protein KatS3mg068_1173 [Candidatus Sericytochromatia bacterium]|nr:MAG: hypothetical protein KatS3mg068_1173 [Candidatus Sericytochromatia bacterium]
MGLKRIAYYLSFLLITSCNTNTNFLPNEHIQDNNSSISNVILDNSNFENINTKIVYDINKENVSIENFIISTNRLIFEEYDNNRNGIIELSELREAPESFRAMDKNNDKKLTFNEITIDQNRIRQQSKWINNFYRQLFDSMDINKDNYVSYNELNLNEDISALNDSQYFTSSSKLLSKNRGKLNFNSFSSLLNSSFLDLQRKFITNNRVAPDFNRSGRLPIILVQGYAEPSWYFMYGIYRNLKKNGWNNIYPVNLFPNINDIREQARIIAKKVEQIKEEQKVSKIDYVAHSMGGLIGRYYIQELNGYKNINNYVSIATPHYGTYTAFLGIGEAAKQIRPKSDFLNKLNSGDFIKPGVKYTSIWTKTDEIVIPAESALLQGSNMMPDIKYVGHFFILWSEETYKQIRETLGAL